MNDPIAIVAPAVDVDVDAERVRILEARKSEADARVIIGEALLRVRLRWPGRGPRAKGWGEFLASVGIEERTARRYMEFAEKFSEKFSDTVSETQPDPPRTYAEAGMDNRPRKSEGSDPPTPVDRDPRCLDLPPRRHDPALNCDANPDGDGVSRGEDYDSDEWYTPERYVEAARLVLGEIDLDPASCKHAQERIRARRFFTKEDDGLSKAWEGRVWLNPPYSQPAASLFARKLLDEYEQGNVTEAILVQNASTDTSWFHDLAAEATVCLVRGRINFDRADGSSSANRYGQVFFYLGHSFDLFEDVFGEFGLVGRLRSRA